jgi:hypothetical protein
MRKLRGLHQPEAVILRESGARAPSAFEPGLIVNSVWVQ